jgi:hypothetical protein
MVKALDNLHVLEVENCRELYTNYGLHLNWNGKEVNLYFWISILLKSNMELTYSVVMSKFEQGILYY